ncbi:MAG: ATP-binding protein [Nitrospirota bacterium]
MKRQLEKVLISRLNKWRSVALLGSRQVGKSYLLKEILKRHQGRIMSFDDPLERVEAAKDPLRYVEHRFQPGKYLFIDEAARVPEIFSAVKILIDRYDPKPTGICLANSGNYLLLRRIKESLAGRINLLAVYPLSWQELAGAKQTPGLISIINDNMPAEISPPESIVEINRMREERILWGGYPAPSLADDRDARIIWSSDYIRTYILPLIVEQFNIRDVSAFEQAAKILFTQNAQFFNASRLAQLTGVSQPTASNYTYQLQAMMVIELVNVFFRNPAKRLVKQSKLYVTDPLLLHQPIGTNFSLQSAIDRGQIGHIYESFILSEMKKTLVNHDIYAENFTWRTQDGAEVDIILSSTGGVVPFEVKWSTKPSRRDASGLHSFLSSYPEIEKGFIVYPGEKIKRITEKVFAVPDWWLFGCF